MTCVAVTTFLSFSLPLNLQAQSGHVNGSYLRPFGTSLTLFVKQTITRDKFENCDDPIKLFTSLLLDAAKASVPQTSTNPKRPDKPWYNDECKQAVNDIKDALKRFNLRPTPENHNQFRIFRAKTRRTIKESKRKSWRRYVSNFNSRTTTKKTWDMIREINGKGYNSINHLKKAILSRIHQKTLQTLLLKLLPENLLLGIILKSAKGSKPQKKRRS